MTDSLNVVPPRGRVGLLLTVFVVPMAVAGSGVVVPTIAQELGDGSTGLQWFVNAFTVLFAAATVPWGIIADRIGSQNVMLLGGVLFVSASVVGAFSDGYMVLDVSRAIVGAGAAGLLVGTTGIIAAFDDTLRLRMFAVFGIVMGLGLALGPTVNGFIVTTTGWRCVLGGPALVVAAGVSLTFGIRITRVVATKQGGIRELLRARLFWTVCAVPVLHAAGFIALLTWLPVVLSAAWRLGPAQIGAVMLFMTVPTLVASPFGSMLAHRTETWNTRRVLLLSLTTLVIGDGLIAFGIASGLPPVTLTGMGLTGVAFGLPLGLLDGAAIGAAPPSSRGVAAGTFNLIRLGSEAATVAALGGALTAAVHSRIPDVAAAQAALAGHGGAGALAESFVPIQGLIVALVTAGSLLIAGSFIAPRWRRTRHSGGDRGPRQVQQHTADLQRTRDRDVDVVG